MTIDKESLRPAFEAWWVDNYGEPVGPVTSDGGYAHQSTDADWLVWCAAFESLGEPVATLGTHPDGSRGVIDQVAPDSGSLDLYRTANWTLEGLYRLPEVKP